MLAEKLKEKKEKLWYKFHSLCTYSEEQSIHFRFDLNASDGHPKSCQQQRTV